MSRLVLKSLEQNFAQLKISKPSQLMIPFNHNQRKLPCLQCIRCYRPRKPFWLPMAKTKMFRIPKHPETPERDAAEILRLSYVYKTQMKSLRLYFKEQLASLTTAPEVIEERKFKELEQHAECIKENDLWNAEVAKLREDRLAKEAIDREQKIVEKIVEHEQQQKQFIEQFDEYIRKEKKAAKSFITPENIDEAIQMALSTVVDHNFAIDKEGNVYEGRYGKPTTPGTKPTQSKPIDTEVPLSVEVHN